MAGCSKVGTPVVDDDPELVVAEPVVVVDWLDAVVDAAVEDVLRSLVELAAVVDVVEVVDSSVAVSSPQPASSTATSDSAAINRMIFISPSLS